MRRLESRQRTNSDVWIHHVACKFPGFLISLRHYLYRYWALIIYFNDRNRVRWVVLGLLQDGACTDLVENQSVSSLKGDLSNATTFINPPLFSLVNTFKSWGWSPLKKVSADKGPQRFMSRNQEESWIVLGCLHVMVWVTIAMKIPHCKWRAGENPI